MQFYDLQYVGAWYQVPGMCVRVEERLDEACSLQNARDHSMKGI